MEKVTLDRNGPEGYAFAAMKICYIHYLYGEQTGLHHVRQFAQAAREIGHEVEVFGTHVGPEEPARGEKVSPWLRLRGHLKRLFSRYLHEPKELLWNALYIPREVELVRSAAPDVLLVRSAFHNYSCTKVADRLGIPLVLEVNAPFQESVLYFDQYWHIPWLPEWIERRKLRRTDAMTVVSSWAKTYMVERYALNPDKVTVVPNGADVSIFHPDMARDSELPPAFDSALVVGFVGSFQKWHGSELLGRMVSEVAAVRPNVHFLLVGDGPDADIVKKISAPLGDRVLFTGKVPHSRVPRLVANMDIAVMPESNAYGSPLKVIEWMAAGKAVVAPSYGPLEDVIDDGVHGLLFPPKDSAALIQAILRLVDDAELRDSLAAAAAERSHASLTWQDNARRVISACEYALEQRA